MESTRFLTVLKGNLQECGCGYVLCLQELYVYMFMTTKEGKTKV